MSQCDCDSCKERKLDALTEALMKRIGSDVNGQKLADYKAADAFFREESAVFKRGQLRVIKGGKP